MLTYKHLYKPFFLFTLSIFSNFAVSSAFEETIEVNVLGQTKKARISNFVNILWAFGEKQGTPTKEYQWIDLFGEKDHSFFNEKEEAAYNALRDKTPLVIFEALGPVQFTESQPSYTMKQKRALLNISGAQSNSPKEYWTTHSSVGEQIHKDLPLRAAFYISEGMRAITRENKPLTLKKIESPQSHDTTFLHSLNLTMDFESTQLATYAYQERSITSGRKVSFKAPDNKNYTLFRETGIYQSDFESKIRITGYAIVHLDDREKPFHVFSMANVFKSFPVTSSYKVNTDVKANEVLFTVKGTYWRDVEFLKIEAAS